MKLYQIDAFTNRLFGGNPAAVCPLKEWLTTEQMQQIAMENNLSETAFYVPNGDEYFLKWFTPVSEIKLCGHATLAAAYVIFEIEKVNKSVLKFHTLSGVLSVTRAAKGFTMDFPADIFNKTDVTEAIKSAVGSDPAEAYFGRDILMVVLNSEKELIDINPDPAKVKLLHRHGLIVTAEGENCDFVSRCFFPNYGLMKIQ